MKKLVIFFLFLLIPGISLAGDTLWVARLKAPDRTVQKVMLPGWYITPAGGTRVDLWCSPLVVRDSSGAAYVDTLSFGPRLKGVDTTLIEFKFTTEDSLPSDYMAGQYILDAQGKFVRR